MSLIIYTKDAIHQEYGIRQIDNGLFKKLMYNEIHKKCRFSIPKEKITKEFNFEFEQKSELETELKCQKNKSQINSEFEYDLESELETELNDNTNDDTNVNVLMLAELNEKQLDKYLEIYQDEQDNLEKFMDFLSIITYNQINPEKFKIKKNFDLILNSLGEYWEDPYNCNYTLTDKFSKRKFNNINYNGFDNNVIQNIKNNFEFNWNAKEINYLNDIIKFNDWKEMCVHKYYVSSISKFTNDEINQIYKQLPSEYLKYTFVSNMLCSRIHCHLILNNKEFLEISKPLFDKYKLVFKYLIGYAWLTLKNDEYHIYHKITDTCRIVFDINTARLLPLFPFTYDDINQNPYACILIDKEILDIKNNCLSMEMIRDYEKYYGVCDSDEFERRLNIFVNGLYDSKKKLNKKGILENIDWDCCVISGSVMTACGMKRNPLIDICKTDNNMNVITDDDLANYFFHYYNDSDIDLICNKKSIYDFIDVVNTFVSKTKLNYKNVSISNIHTATIILSDEFILGELDSISKIIQSDKSNSIDVAFVKSNFNNLDIKKYFYTKYYIPWKNEQVEYLTKLNRDINHELIKDYLKPIPAEEFRLYSFDYELDTDKYTTQDYEKYFYSNSNSNFNSNSNPTESNIISAKLSESIRFKISNPNTKTFEIFKSRDSNFFSIVSRFHMGFVRALWNGKTVLCLPSYITSMMLQLAVDYKYFASVRDPIEIVNKYRSRGYGIILNGFEKLHMAYYNSSKLATDANSKWVEMYKVDIKVKKTVENIFGIKKSSDDIFKPSKYFMGIPSDCYKNINHDTVNTFDECFSTLITPSLTKISKSKAINDNGKINPLSREIINLGWNLLNNQIN
jgi:hypothetical protein